MTTIKSIHTNKYEIKLVELEQDNGYRVAFKFPGKQMVLSTKMIDLRLALDYFDITLDKIDQIA
jgi:hypothetical protein